MWRLFDYNIDVITCNYNHWHGNHEWSHRPENHNKPGREKITEKVRSCKLDQYYDCFRKLKSTVTKNKNLRLESRNSDLYERNMLPGWTLTKIFWIHLMSLWRTREEQTDYWSSGLCYDIFLTNFKKEAEAIFSTESEIMLWTLEQKQVETHSYSSRSSHITKDRRITSAKSLITEKERTRKGKIKLKLGKEKFNLETDIAISNATRVRRRYIIRP
jgi:hypothetical protein